MKVTMDDVLTLIQTVSESNLTKFQFSDHDFSVSMNSSKKKKRVVIGQEEEERRENILERRKSFEKEKSEKIVENVVEPKEEKEEGESDGKNSVFITSPLVGTFYAAKAEGESPYIQVGDSIKKGQVVGIVEAMKLMNEVESEYDGVVAEILVQNEQMVEYEQPLVRIERSEN